MNPLDARARHATQAIHDCMAAAAPPVPFATVVRRAAIAKFVNLLLIGAGATLFIAAGAAFRAPQPELPAADTVVSTTTSTAAPSTTAGQSTTTEVVTLPATTEVPPSTSPPSVSTVPGSTQAPTATTTSTTEPPPPTTTEPPPSTTTTTTKPPDTEPPRIVITFPENRQRFTDNDVTFRGVTEPGATVTRGDRDAVVDGEGHWRMRLRLQPGRQRVVFTATDAAGNSAHAAVVVFYQPPDLAAFTAHATYGSCEIDPPFDIYYGTGEPGTRVGVISEYGSGVTTIGANGEWELKVYFPEAPYKEPFPVRAVDEFGRARTFEFVSYVGEGA